MNHKRSTKGFNNYWNDQPNLFGNNVNRGKEEEILADEDGRVRDGYKSNSTEREIQDTGKEIKDYLKVKFNSDLGVEIATDETFKYAISSRVDREDLEEPSPDGVGPPPVRVDEANPTRAERSEESRYEKAVHEFDKSVLAKHNQYRLDFRNAVAHVLKYFCSQSVRQAIETDRDFIDAQGPTKDILSFLNVLEECVRKVSKPGLSGENLFNRKREDLKNAISNLQVRDYHNSLLYTQMLQKMLIQYKKLLVDERVSKLSPTLTPLQRTERKDEIESEIQDEVDRDEIMQQKIYWEYYNHAMLPKYREVDDLERTRMLCGAKETPYRRRVNADGNVIGGIDVMLRKFINIAQASISEVGHAISMVKKPSYKRPLNPTNDSDKKPRLDIAINSQQVITTPCSYCLNRLKFKQAADKHDWKSCMYNKDCVNYVGDEKKALREAKADKFSGRQYQRNEHGQGRGNRGGRRGRG
jgi:hypothetical protein